MWNCLARKELIATRGVPGCGKSTWAKAWVAGTPHRVRVNRDDLRMQMFGSYYGPEVDESAVSIAQNSIILALLKADYSVIVDNTHIGIRTLRGLKGLATGNTVFRVIQFDVPLEVAIQRNAARDRVVPEDVIKNMYDRLQENPIPDEWRF